MFGPTCRDGSRDIELSPHDPVDFPCGNNSIGRVNVHPLAGVDPLPRRHRVEITTAHHLLPFDVHARCPPSANTTRHRPRLPMQSSYEAFQVLSNAVDRNRGCEPFHSICGNFNFATEAPPCSVEQSMLPLPDIVTSGNTIGRKVDVLCEAKTIVIGRGDAGRHKK